MDSIDLKTTDLPRMDLANAPTGCCPRFDPEGWDGLEVHFEDTPFVRATTRSLMHIPLNMGTVFSRVQAHIEDEEMTRLSGTFLTRVFEGPYRHAGDWVRAMEVAAKAAGKTGGRVFMFYTTCPKCAKAYGQNYVVGFIEV